MADNSITVWPCDHGNVLVEHGSVPLGATCHECGARPTRYLSVEAARLLVQKAVSDTADDGKNDLLNAIYGALDDIATASSREKQP